MLEGAQPLVIVYRIYYKLMKTTLEPQALMESPKARLYCYKLVQVIHILESPHKLIGMKSSYPIDGY